MDRPPHMPPEEFLRRAAEIARRIADYHERGAHEASVLSTSAPGAVAAMLPAAPPDHGEPWDDILADIERIVMPGITHWQSPNFFGYFPANASYPAILGELLAAGLAVQGMLWQTSPACTELETRVLDWLGAAIGLPEPFLSTSPSGGGVLQGTASEATLVALVAARHRLAARLGAEHPPCAVYCSDQAHSSVIKAAMIAGLGAPAVRRIPSDDALAMDAGALRAAMDADVAAGVHPALVVATLGTTSTGAIDPLGPITDAALAHRARTHVDAAWAGSAAICPEFRAMLAGVERVDSFSFNPHKWLLTNFDCAAFWVRDRTALVEALSITPEYLRNAASDAGAVIDYRDWQIPLGRRMRALKLWFVMRHYGIEGLRTHIRAHVRAAESLEAAVRADARFEVPVPRSLALLCLRLRAGDDATRRVLERVNASGRAFLTHTIVPVRGRPTYLIRIAIGATRTEQRHAMALWDLLRSMAD